MTVQGGEKTVAELAEICGATVEGDPGRVVTGPSGLAEAGPSQVSFLAQPKYAPQLGTTGAGAVLVAHDQAVEREDLTLLRCENPEAAFTKVILAFSPPVPEVPLGVSEAAEIHPSAKIGAGVRIAAHVTVGEHAIIADGVTLDAGVRVQARASVGADSKLHPGVVIYPHCEVGARCILHANVVVGSEGFGFHPVPGSTPLWQKTPQAGNVVIEDDCEVGAGSTIDCARFGSTRIGRGCKLDNLVHVGHNVQVGADTLLLAHVGIAGSTTIGKNVIVAGQAGVTGHVHIGDGAIIMGGAGVIADVPAGTEMFGYPAAPRREKMKSIVRAQRAGKDVVRLKSELKELRAQLAALDERVAALKDGGGTGS